MKKYYVSIFVSLFVATASLSFSLAHGQVKSVGPTIPSTISASVLPSSQVYVSWSASTDSVQINDYYLYRNGQMIATVPGYTYYSDKPGPGVFTYTVVAADVAGNSSAQSNPSSAVTVTADTTPPSTPANLTATVSSSSVVLSWQASTDNAGVTGYYVSRNGTRILTNTPIAQTTYTDTGLALGTTYHYTVQAYDAAGNYSNSAAISATTIYDITPPSVPQNLVATPISPSEISLTWQPSTDNIQVSGYEIYRNGSPHASVASTTNAYLDSNLSAETSYYYNVAAYDEVDNMSAKSMQATTTTLPNDITPPSTPKNFTATPLSPSTVQLNWSSSTDNVAVDDYDIYRAGIEVATTASTSYLDTDLATDTFYAYGVSAVDTSENKSPQAGAGATTLSYTPVHATTTPSQPNTSTSNPSAPTLSNLPAGYTSPLSPSSPTVSVPPTTSPTPTQTTSHTLLTTNLYYGSRNAQVTILQSFLIQTKYLQPSYATGFFGSLTAAAVRQFQCDKDIVCSGSAGTTGWGSVGPHTRAVINEE